MAINGDLMRGVAEPVILKLLSRKSMYGYEMIRTVDEQSGGIFQWKEGSLYPCLHRMEGAGLISSSWEVSDETRPRKYYSITKKGLAVLKTKTVEIGEFSHAMNLLLLNA